MDLEGLGSTKLIGEDGSEVRPQDIKLPNDLLRNFFKVRVTWYFGSHV